MKTLRGMSISRRLWLILVLAVAMLVTLGLLMLNQIHTDLYKAKAEKTLYAVQCLCVFHLHFHRHPRRQHYRQ